MSRLLILVVFLLVVGCGQKSALYQPVPPPMEPRIEKQPETEKSVPKINVEQKVLQQPQKDHQK